tara:strand:- start:47 stop:1498 length:1452 start_codon:yes stop_codon:yes gene_type:complete
MRSLNIIFVFFLLSIIIAQEEDSKKNNRKVYRTQSGAIIEAPRPLFNNPIKKKKTKPQVKNEKNKTLARTKRVETTYRNELDSLKNTVAALLKQSKVLQDNYEEKLSQNLNDTIFVYTTLYDTTTILDTTFIYTNATTTVYDTVVVIDSIYINNYDTTTLIQTNYDTVFVMDTTVLVNYDTTVIKDTVWAFAYDTTYFYDTTWVFAHDTTVLRDSIWLFAVDTIKTYDTLVVSKNDTVTIHTYSSKFPENFSPDMIDQKQSAFPKYKTLADALRARDMGDKSAQGWINQALNAAGGDWSRAEREYKKLQEIYSTAMVQAITREPKDPSFIGPDLKYKNVIFDTLKILTFDTTLVQDTVKNLVKQTYIKYDTSIVDNRREVIANTTPPGHELIIKYHRNGRVKERGLMKGSKKNGEWIQYDTKGLPLRKSFYDMGKLVDDNLIVIGNENENNPMDDIKNYTKKKRLSDKPKAKKSKSIFKLFKK